MTDDNADSIIDTQWPRRSSELRLVYLANDESGTTQQAWGVVIEGDLPLNPRTIEQEVKRLPWPDRADEELPDVEVIRHEFRSGPGQSIVQLFVESGPGAILGAIVAEALHALIEKLGPWTRPKWGQGPEELRTSDEVLAYATRRAKEVAYNVFRDIADDPPNIIVVSQSISQPSNLNDAAATIVLRSSDAEIFTIQLWLADGAERYTTTRTRL